MATPPEQQDVQRLLDSDNPELVTLRETYTATAEHATPTIEERIAETEELAVATERPAVGVFSGLSPGDALSDSFDTWVVFSQAATEDLEDPRYEYVVELDSLAGFEERPDIDESYERIVGAWGAFVPDMPMDDMRTIEPPENQRFGPAVLSATRRLRSLAEQPNAEVAVRISRLNVSSEPIAEDVPTRLGPAALAFVRL